MFRFNISFANGRPTFLLPDGGIGAVEFVCDFRRFVH